MWWKEQTNTTKDLVRKLVANGQFQFVNGGWCMHDEAATHYTGMLDQTTLGHQFLWRELQYIPRSGWQLDPFGHSATQANLFTARVGFDSLFFGRIDYEDRKVRFSTQDCEGLWHTNLNDTVFWGLSGGYSGYYFGPPIVCFDMLCADKPLIELNRTSLDNAILQFLYQIRGQEWLTKGNHIMLTMGSDFHVSAPVPKPCIFSFSIPVFIFLF
jgi:hypothetical protein